MSTASVLADVAEERVRQHDKWGTQNHPDGTGFLDQRERARLSRIACDNRFRQLQGTWRDILDEEVAEAYAEADPARLREELCHVAAVAVAWCEAIDRRLASGARAA